MCLLLQPGENKFISSSYGSLSFLPASMLAPCLPWVCTVFMVRHSETAGVVSRTHHRQGSLRLRWMEEAVAPR